MNTLSQYDMSWIDWSAYVNPLAATLRIPSLVIDEPGAEVVIPDAVSGLRIPFGVNNVSVLALDSVLGPVVLEPLSDGFTGDFTRDVESLSANDSWRLEADIGGSLGDFFGVDLNGADIDVGNTLRTTTVLDSRDVRIDTEVLFGDANFEEVRGLTFTPEVVFNSGIEGEGLTGFSFETELFVQSDLAIEDGVAVELFIEEFLFSKAFLAEIRSGSFRVEEGDVEAALRDVEQFVFRSAEGDDDLNVRGAEELAVNTGAGNDRITIEDVEEGVIDAGAGNDRIAAEGVVDEVLLLGGAGSDHFDLRDWSEGDVATDFNPSDGDTGQIGFAKFSLGLDLLYAAADDGQANLGDDRSIEFLDWTANQAGDALFT